MPSARRRATMASTAARRRRAWPFSVFSKPYGGVVIAAHDLAVRAQDAHDVVDGVGERVDGHRVEGVAAAALVDVGQVEPAAADEAGEDDLGVRVGGLDG